MSTSDSILNDLIGLIWGTDEYENPPDPDFIIDKIVEYGKQKYSEGADDQRRLGTFS